MHALVAPDKFKGSLTAAQVAGHVAAGLRRAVPDLTVVTRPVADGGEGTLDAAVEAGFTRVPVTATGPTGEPVAAAIGVRDGTAVVELAQASGLAQLPGGRPAALSATSRGTGDLVRAALNAGCDTVVLAIGGSACTDGGAGLVQALGARLLDESGAELGPGGAALRGLDRVDLTGLDPRLAATTVVLASDVDNPLLGPHGAAAVYGPQKGAGPGEIEVLDAGLARWADRLPGGQLHAGAPGAGAAGGVGFAALAVLGAVRRPGIDVLLELVGFADALSGAVLVVTGEGSLDAQSLHGKAPVGVAAAARRRGLPVVGVAGRCTLRPDELARAGLVAAYSLTDLEPDVGRCMAQAGPLLERLTAERVAGHLPAEVRRPAVARE